jgi:hypothetical protein
MIWYLIEGDSLAPAGAGHEEAVANFVFKKPLEREGRVQYEITHRRWPS